MQTMRTRRRGRAAYDFPLEHPFKERFRRLGVKQWELRNYTGVSESKLSRYLNGIDPMPEALERTLSEFLEIVAMARERQTPGGDTGFGVLDSGRGNTEGLLPDPESKKS